MRADYLADEVKCSGNYAETAIKNSQHFVEVISTPQLRVASCRVAQVAELPVELRVHQCAVISNEPNMTYNDSCELSFVQRNLFKLICLRTKL